MKHLLLTLLAVCFCLPLFAQEPLDLGSKRELFVDNYLIDTLDNLSLKLHEPVFRDVSFKFDEPWEGLFSGCVTIIHDNGKYRAYYRGRPEFGTGSDDDPSQVACVAFSDDGIHWTKPKLGLIEKNGSKENNIYMTDPNISHNFAPVIDDRPGVPAEERYKGLGGGRDHGGLFALSSPDGLVWKKMSEKPVLPYTSLSTFDLKHNNHLYRVEFDTHNVAFWSPSENCYVVYFRVIPQGYTRHLGRATSKDFLHWENIQVMDVIHDGQLAPFEQYYINQTHKYFRAPHIYIATPARMMDGRDATDEHTYNPNSQLARRKVVLTEEQAAEAKIDPTYYKLTTHERSDVVLMSSRGGNRYDRTFMESFVRPGIGYAYWGSRANFPGRNFVQTGATEMSFYALGGYGITGGGELRRFTLRLDGFASLHAPYVGGTFVSKPLTFSGKRLSLNYSTSVAGGLKVQLEQPDGTPYPGFALSDCKEVIGNEIARDVLWANGADVSSLAGKIVRIRITMNDADLYSLKFEE